MEREKDLLVEKAKGNESTSIARNLDGLPVPSLTTCYTLGPRGPVLMQDDNCLQRLKNFVRGNPSPRFVRSKGIGAYGTFKVTNDITNLTSANLFSQVGKKTNVFCRFSSADDPGNPDASAVLTAAFKFYTQEGNFDLLTLPIPVFLFSDPINQLGYIRSVGLNPQTNLNDQNMRWDFLLQVPESVHHTMLTMSDKYCGKTFRNAELSAINVFHLVNAEGQCQYCKWTLVPNQGFESISPDEILETRAKDPDFQIRDFFEAIDQGQYPSWTLNVQTMTEDQVSSFTDKATGVKLSPFDLTKMWPRDEYPMQKVGILKVKRNVDNHFNETEQVAFNPGRLVPGIVIPVQDALLQGRSFAYRAAHAYRTGINSNQLPVNYPKGVKGKLYTYSRDGAMNSDTVNGGAPDYYPNSFGGPTVQTVEVKGQFVNGKVGRKTENPTDIYSQPREFWAGLTNEEKMNLVGNIVGSANKTENFIKKGIIAQFSLVSQEMGDMIENEFKKV